MQQIITKLDEKTNEIKHHEQSFMSNVLAIGKILAEIHKDKIYKEKYNSFEDYIKAANFTFTRQYAYKYIDLYKKYGENVKQFDKIKPYGMRVLIMSLYVPDDRLDELVEVIEKAPLKDHTTLAKQVKRFAKEVGSKPRYEDLLEQPSRQEERLLKAKREAQEIKEKYQDFLEIKTNLSLAIENWVSSYKYQELNVLKEELQAIVIDLIP